MTKPVNEKKPKPHSDLGIYFDASRERGTKHTK